MYVNDNKGHVFPYIYKPTQIGWPAILQQYVSLNGSSVYNYNGTQILQEWPVAVPVGAGTGRRAGSQMGDPNPGQDRDQLLRTELQQ